MANEDIIDSKKILKEIKELVKNIYRVKSYTEYKYMIISVDLLIDMYYELTGIDLDIKIPTIESYERILKKKIFTASDINIDEYLGNRGEVTFLSKSVIDAFDKKNYAYYSKEYNEKRLCRKEFFEIMENFLLSYDKRLYNLYRECMNNKKVDIDTEKYDYTNSTRIIYIPRNTYILLDRNPTVEGISTFVHELGHYYEFGVLGNISKRQMYYTEKTYFEMYPHYLELLFFDYLKDNHIYVNDMISTENSFYYACLSDFTKLYDYRDISIEKDDGDIRRDISFLYLYSYSRLIAILLHNKYLSDKKDTKKRIDEYISLDGLIDKTESLDVLGINKKDLFDTKVLEKRLENHKEMIKKYS